MSPVIHVLAADDPAVLRLMAIFLRRAGHRVTAAGGGADALAMAQ